MYKITEGLRHEVQESSYSPLQARHDGCAGAGGSGAERWPEMKVEWPVCSRSCLQLTSQAKAPKLPKLVGQPTLAQRSSRLKLIDAFPRTKMGVLGTVTESPMSQAKCSSLSWLQVSFPAADTCSAAHSLLLTGSTLQQRRGLGPALPPKWSPSLC